MAYCNQNVLCSIAFKVQLSRAGVVPVPLPSREIVFLGCVQTRNAVHTALLLRYCNIAKARLFGETK
jgi:hypothetical protein